MKTKLLLSIIISAIVFSSAIGYLIYLDTPKTPWDCRMKYGKVQQDIQNCLDHLPSGTKPSQTNSESMPIAVVTENYPDSCSYDMILFLKENSNMASDAKDFGLSVTNIPEDVDMESFHTCMVELDSMISKQNTEMSEKINEVLARPCEEITIQPEWSEPNEYTRAYDVRFSQCKTWNDILYDCKNGIVSEKMELTNNTHSIDNTDCEWKEIENEN